MQDDLRWMRRTLELARKGLGNVHPNPMVGCVLVRGGRRIAEGYHQAFGQDHAEIDALRIAGARARGATLYVNLEPCAHWGKTPPCIDAILSAGVQRVVGAMKDPNPLVAGKGFAGLRRKKIKVTTGVMEKEALDLNRAFRSWIVRKRPFVTLKAASSLDGKIATRTGESRWISGPEARRFGHLLRVEADAIAVGVGTVLADNPELTAHGQGRNPRRIVFDSHLRLPVRSHFVQHGAGAMVFATSKASPQKVRTLEKKGVTVFQMKANPQGLVSLPDALAVLAREGVAHLLVEGGGTLHAGFLEAHLVDEVVWFIAPMLMGGATAKTAVEGSGVSHLKDAWRLNEIRIETLGNDICLRGRLI